MAFGQIGHRYTHAHSYVDGIRVAMVVLTAAG